MLDLSPQSASSIAYLRASDILVDSSTFTDGSFLIKGSNFNSSYVSGVTVSKCTLSSSPLAYDVGFMFQLNYFGMYDVMIVDNVEITNYGVLA